MYAHKEVNVDSNATTTAMPASIRSTPLTAGASPLTSTSVSPFAGSGRWTALGTFLITGAAAAVTGATPFGKATVAEGGTARGTVALGIGTGIGTGLPDAGLDCSFTVARGGAGETAETTVSATPFSAVAVEGTTADRTGLVATAGIPAEVAERRGTVCFPEDSKVTPEAAGKLGAEGGVKDTGFTGAGGATDIGAVTVTDEEGIEGLRGGGGGVPALEMLGGL